jgi:hypothetical protein
MRIESNRVIPGLIVGISILSLVLISLLSHIEHRSEIKTLYIGFDFSDPTNPVSSIVHESQAVRPDSALPFIPAAKVEMRTWEKLLDWYSTGSVSKLESERSMIIRITDGEDREGEKSYWHFPSANSHNTMDAGLSEVVEEIQGDLDLLPEGVGDTMNTRLDEMYGRGQDIPELRRVALIDLMKSALYNSGYEWVIVDLEAGKSRVKETHRAGYIEVVGFSVVAFMISILIGVGVSILQHKQSKQ